MKLKIHIVILVLLISAFILLILALSADVVMGQEKEQQKQAQPATETEAKEAEKPSSEEDPADNGPGDDYVIEGIKKEKGAVPFKHFTHASTKKGYKIPCKECHHTAEGNEVDSGCSGADCHGDTKVGKKLALKGAYHKNCYACHLKHNKQNKTDKAPRKCDGCHK